MPSLLYRLVHTLRPAYFLASLFLISACGEKQADKNTASQTVARAQGVEITIHELKHGMVGAKFTPETEQRLLESMVDQTLFAQRAIKEGLEQDPKVALSLASARRAVLAQAYAEKFSERLPTPTELEAKAYFDKHPELFSDRRVYTIRDMGVLVKTISSDDMKAVVKGSKSIEDVKRKLSEKGISVEILQRTSAAEELPNDLSRAFSTMKIGSLGLIAMPTQTQVVQLLDSVLTPVTFAAAKPAIAQALYNDAKRAKLSSLVETARKEGKVEYLGKYAANATAAATATLPSKAKDQTTAKTPESAIDRGVASMR